MAAGDNAVVANNLWRNANLNLFRRSGGLHAQAYLTDGDEENVWADAWHGKYAGASGYGRSLSQSYNGMQAGYDKLLSKRILDGKVYVGFVINKAAGKSNTSSGSGEQDGLGTGIYTSWVGTKGHYLDLGVQVLKLGNEYSFSDSSGRVTGDMDTWAYGLGAQYGYRQSFKNGFFVEPSATLLVGHTEGKTYQLSNRLMIEQNSADNVTGRLGLTLGKQFGSDGELHAGVARYQQNGGGAGIDMRYGSNVRSVELPDGSDKWWEFNLGGNLKISPTGRLEFDYYKTSGGDLGSDWRLSGGVNWYWGGFGGKNTDRGSTAVKAADTAAENAALNYAAEKVGNVTVPTLQAGSEQAICYEGGAAVTAGDNHISADQDGGKVVADSTGVVSGTVRDGMGEFELGGLTVEAKRPDWEKNLSPGSVTVIHPEEFRGEQKDLPDLLERVPGLFVQRISGTGHYTVARVRASTAAQVNVYVDGVLMNLNGDAAVNLSIIPVDNVERIEVYRGYVPARFSGAPLGGVINVVTKKPVKGSGRITQGIKSYGGYSSSYEYTMPLGGGSLLAAYNRNDWKGDFPFRAGIAEICQEEKQVSNGFRNSDVLLKWQDEHWMAKAAYKKDHEELPFGFGGVYWSEDFLQEYYGGKCLSYQDITTKELQLGRRDTVGKLDWGWRLQYFDSKKAYRYPSLMAEYDPDDPGAINGGMAPGSIFADYHSKKWGGNLNAAYQLGSNHLLEFNGDFSRENMSADGSHWNYYNATAGKYFGRAYIPKYRINEYHLTLQDTFSLDEAQSFKLTPILRADKVEMETMSDNDARWKYSAGLALQKQFNEHWSIKTTWGTYNRHPNFYEIFGDGASIRPNTGLMNAWDLASHGAWESGSQFDFGVNWNGKFVAADTDLTLTLFQRDTRNQLILSQPPQPGAHASYLALDAVKARGIELNGTLKWRRLSLSAAMTWTDAYYNGVENRFNHKGDIIPFTPEWYANVRLDYLFPGDKLSTFLEWNYTDIQSLVTGGQDVQNTGWGWLEALATVNLGAKYSFRKDLKLNFGVNDVFNQGYDRMYRMYSSVGVIPYTSSYPTIGRNYYTTLEYSF